MAHIHEKIDWKQWSIVLLGVFAVFVGEGVVIAHGLPWYWAAAVFVVAVACFTFVGAQQDKRRIEKYFSGRPVLGEKEFGTHYFPPDRAEIAGRLRKILSNHIDIDLARINPADRLIEDLRMDDYDSLASADFVIEIEKEFGIAVPNEASEKMTTFQSVVDYVAEALKGGPV